MTDQKLLNLRIAQERKAVRHLIRYSTAAGFAVTQVDNGEEVVKCSTEAKAMAAVFSVDESTIYFKHPNQPKNHCAVIVLGNSGAECIADASQGPLWDEVIKEVFQYCEKF